MEYDFIDEVIDNLIKNNDYEQYQIDALEQNIDGLEDQIIYTFGNESLINSIKWYTTKEYQDFNIAIRENKWLSKKHMKYLNSIKKAFIEVPPVHKNQRLVVYRGVQQFNNTHRNNLLKNFLSTTLSIEEALTYTHDDCCVFRITVLPGSKILPLFIHSACSGELEILLDSNAYIYINNIPTKYKGVNIYDIQYSPVELQPKLIYNISGMSPIPKFKSPVYKKRAKKIPNSRNYSLD